MPFYFRKSIKAGPFRFNFSSGGVGASVGVKGLRIGTGPRGHYVHAGRGGFYYRATIGSPGARRGNVKSVLATGKPQVPASDFQGGVHMVEVDSGDVLAMRDSAYSEILDEINEKRQKPSAALLFGLGFGLLGLLAVAVTGSPGMIVWLLGLGAWAFGAWLDSYQRTVVLFYDLEGTTHTAYEHVVESFDRMAASHGKWHIEAGGSVQDLTTWKRNAGASHIVKRNPTSLTYALPKAVTCNVTPPSIHVGKQVIYFLPDVAFIDDGRKVGAVSYADLMVQWQPSNFIEEGTVPQDCEIIYRTWKHPNKNGGPDRRFRDNRQLPVCRYEAMHMRSASGVNELVEFSKVGVVAPFAEALKAMPKRAKQQPSLQIGTSG